MNLFRGIVSIGIIIGCVLNWVSIEMALGIMYMAGLEWPPAMILLLASFLTAGYAFYSNYNSSNQNIWIYLTVGLFGIGVCIYRYFTFQEVADTVSFMDTIGPHPIFESITLDLGFYLTALFSTLLFFTGFDKADNKDQMTQLPFDQRYPQSLQSDSKPTNPDKPNLQDWLKENPGKSINDYFLKHWKV